MLSNSGFKYRINVYPTVQPTPFTIFEQLLETTSLDSLCDKRYTFTMIQIIASSLVGFITFVILDYIWLAHIAKDFYLQKLATHITLKDGGLVPYIPAIPLVYIVAIIGIWFFVLGKATTHLEAFLYGAVFGFVIYAFYDFTNLATLKDYPWSLTIVDILWGTFAVATISSLMFFIKGVLS